jgi:hypothetical protein
MKYPKGTPLTAIKQFDRSTHIAFECPKHPGQTFSSKDPNVSRWFGSGQPCDDDLSEFVTAAEYDDGGGGGNYDYYLTRPERDGREKG